MFADRGKALLTASQGVLMEGGDPFCNSAIPLLIVSNYIGHMSCKTKRLLTTQVCIRIKVVCAYHWQHERTDQVFAACCCPPPCQAFPPYSENSDGCIITFLDSPRWAFTLKCRPHRKLGCSLESHCLVPFLWLRRCHRLKLLALS